MADELFGVLPEQQARLNISENGYAVSGLVASSDDKDAILLRAKLSAG
ncbi:MAG: hypothetical protein R3E95_11410 [Thiolinea sp.]